MPALPSIVAWTLGAIGAVVLVKLFSKEWQRVNAELDQARPVRVTDPERARLPQLRRDPRDRRLSALSLSCCPRPGRSAARQWCAADPGPLRMLQCETVPDQRCIISRHKAAFGQPSTPPRWRRLWRSRCDRIRDTRAQYASPAP